MTKEVDVGIAEYAQPSIGGIGGVLKRLHTDFCVNELDVNGNEIDLDVVLPHGNSGMNSGGSATSKKEVEVLVARGPNAAASCESDESTTAAADNEDAFDDDDNAARG